MKKLNWILMWVVVTEITWGPAAWAEIAPHAEDSSQTLSHRPVAAQAIVPMYLKAAGIKKTRVAFTIEEAPLTFQDAWLACMKWGMVLPTIEQLTLLKPHLNSLLSGLTYRDRGFVWSISATGNKKYPRKVFSLAAGSPQITTESAKGIALCVDSETVPQEVRLSQMLSNELEQAYRGEVNAGTDSYFSAEKALKRFEKLFPNLTEVGHHAARRSFNSRRADDPAYQAAWKKEKDRQAEEDRKEKERIAKHGPRIGVTSGGKPGLYHNGIVIPFDGSTPEFGF